MKLKHPHQTFVTVLNCIDGRVQEPARKYIVKTFQADFADAITYPGIDKVLGENFHEIAEQIKEEVLISLNAHNSKTIAVCGHHYCAANPVSKREHKIHILRAIETVRSWALPVDQIIGLFVNKDFEVEKVA